MFIYINIISKNTPIPDLSAYVIRSKVYSIFSKLFNSRRQENYPSSGFLEAFKKCYGGEFRQTMTNMVRVYTPKIFCFLPYLSGHL
jgi:hypothetical protein